MKRWPASSLLPAATCIGCLVTAAYQRGCMPRPCAGALARTLPLSAGLNAPIERVPSWAAGLAYSMFVATGGRLGQQLFEPFLGETIQRRARRTREASPAFADFLVSQFEHPADDAAWRNFLQRKALSTGAGPRTRRIRLAAANRRFSRLNRAAQPGHGEQHAGPKVTRGHDAARG
jgi:hypothetical protein